MPTVTRESKPELSKIQVAQVLYACTGAGRPKAGLAATRLALCPLGDPRYRCRTVPAARTNTNRTIGLIQTTFLTWRGQ